jgi:hypothetical protein
MIIISLCNFTRSIKSHPYIYNKKWPVVANLRLPARSALSANASPLTSHAKWLPGRSALSAARVKTKSLPSK